jgi:hypothetical protein
MTMNKCLSENSAEAAPTPPDTCTGAALWRKCRCCRASEPGPLFSDRYQALGIEPYTQTLGISVTGAAAIGRSPQPGG